MGLKDYLETSISTTLNATWNSRDGQVVPKTGDVALSNGAVKLDAVFLYADLFDSTILATTFPHTVAAKVVRIYLSSMSKIIREHGGSIRSFDGDRVMGIFIGNSKRSDAAKCALRMKWAVDNIVRPMAAKQFPSLVSAGYEIRHCVGIDRSEVWAVRSGIRGSNDLVFVGAAPNFAAKLSAIRDGYYNTYITFDIYYYLNADSTYKNSIEKTNDMWTPTLVELGGKQEVCYKSAYEWASS